MLYLDLHQGSKAFLWPSNAIYFLSWFIIVRPAMTRLSATSILYVYIICLHYMFTMKDGISIQLVIIQNIYMLPLVYTVGRCISKCFGIITLTLECSIPPSNGYTLCLHSVHKLTLVYASNVYICICVPLWVVGITKTSTIFLVFMHTFRAAELPWTSGKSTFTVHITE